MVGHDPEYVSAPFEGLALPKHKRDRPAHEFAAHHAAPGSVLAGQWGEPAEVDVHPAELVPCPLTFAPFLVRGLAGASAVWLADLELARLGRGDRAGVRSPQVAGDGPHEHHGKQDNR